MYSRHKRKKHPRKQTAGHHRVEQIGRVSMPQQDDVLTQLNEAGAGGRILSLQPGRGVRARCYALHRLLTAPMVSGSGVALTCLSVRPGSRGSLIRERIQTGHHRSSAHRGVLTLNPAECPGHSVVFLGTCQAGEAEMLPGKGSPKAEAPMRPLFHVLRGCLRRQLAKDALQLCRCDVRLAQPADLAQTPKPTFSRCSYDCRQSAVERRSYTIAVFCTLTCLRLLGLHSRVLLILLQIL